MNWNQLRLIIIWIRLWHSIKSINLNQFLMILNRIIDSFPYHIFQILFNNFDFNWITINFDHSPSRHHLRISWYSIEWDRKRNRRCSGRQPWNYPDYRPIRCRRVSSWVSTDHNQSYKATELIEMNVSTRVTD